jgi:hypothetical protein
MSALPPNYLAKPGGKWREVRLLDIAVMLLHVHLGAKEEHVGFEDARETIDTLTRKLNKKVLVDPVLLESCLWSCNLMNEAGKWWHPRDNNFDEFLKDVLGAAKFNKVYNVIEREKKA